MRTHTLHDLVDYSLSCSNRHIVDDYFGSTSSEEAGIPREEYPKDPFSLAETMLGIKLTFSLCRFQLLLLIPRDP